MISSEICNEIIIPFSSLEEEVTTQDNEPPGSLEGNQDGCSYQLLAIVPEGSDPNTIFIDNVTVQKKKGKRNKYQIDVDAENPKCPQPSERQEGIQDGSSCRLLAIVPECSDPKNKEETIFIDNVTVQKRTGKRNKYQMDVDAENPKCPQPKCGRKFATATLLKDHVRKVHCADRNRFSCDMCPLAFPAKYLLRRHTETHTKEKRECPICDMKLSARTDLKVHMSTHKDNRPYRCEVCSESFTRSFSLHRHARVRHPAARPSYTSTS